MAGYQLPSRQLISQSDASLTSRADVPRTRFEGSWSRKTAFDAGYLVPILVDEILPGDHMRYDITAYIRMATPLFPMLDNQRVDTFFFYVPYRILYQYWEKLQGAQASPGDTIAYTAPRVGLQNAAIGGMADHFGLPLNVTTEVQVSAFPFRAYNLIYNEWFRDQNIQAAAPVWTDDSYITPAQIAANYPLRRRNKAHDYFTSALPWPQKFTAPNLPLLGQAPITGLFYPTPYTGTLAGPTTGYDSVTGSGSKQYTDYLLSTAAAALGIDYIADAAISGFRPNIFADLTLATGVSINDLRNAFLTQALLERDARGGTRYTELIKNHFGVTNPDFRLQRPEYIGGGQTPLNITPIAQTAPGTGSVVGQLGGAGTAAGTHTASFAATEHGVILGLINVRSDISYFQGIHKMWTRRTRYDFYMPALAGLGEQAVLRKEIYATGTIASDDTVFGYQERYQEYRVRQSEVVGIMRSNVAGTLDMWHLAQNFGAAPVLNSAFLEDTPPMSRVLAAGALANGQQYIGDIFYRRTAVRPIPQYGTPVQLGRF